MRCPNCGFISFDYLEQCFRCSTDLTRERQRLNLPDMRPNPISFLEIMERMPMITQKEKKLRGEETTVKTRVSEIPKRPEIDLSQELSLDISIPSDLRSAHMEQKTSGPNEKERELTLEGFDINGSSEKESES